MNKQQLRLYYIYFIPITIIQSISTLLMMTVYSVEDYGAFNLYLTNINIFFFLTLGLQLGYTIKLNSNVDNKRDYTSLILVITNLLAIAYSFILVLATFAFNLTLFNFLSCLSAIIFVLFIVQKSIFQTNYLIHTLNIYILIFRLTFVFDIVFYLFSPHILQVIIFDIILRLILVTGGNILIFKQVGFKSKVFNVDYLNQIKDTINIGIPLMLGNWITMLYLIADKYVLRDNLNALGLYSFAITFVLLLRVLITPIKDLLFVSMAQNSQGDNTTANTSRALLIGSILLILSAGGFLLFTNVTNIFSKFDAAMPSLYILLCLLPLTIALDLFLYNNTRVDNQKLFLVKAAFSAIVLFSTLFIYVEFAANFSLIVYSLLVVLGYNIIFLIFSWNIDPKRYVLKSYYFFLIFEILYLAMIIFI